jgi:hypothetical protein
MMQIEEIGIFLGELPLTYDHNIFDALFFSKVVDKRNLEKKISPLEKMRVKHFFRLIFQSWGSYAAEILPSWQHRFKRI